MAASNALTNTIGATGQGVSIYVPAGGAVRVNIGGTFSGTISFTLNQGAGANAVNLINTSSGSFTDQSASAAGSWLYLPTTSGTLQVSATAWTSGTATVDVIDLVANPANVDLVLLPSGARSTTQTLSILANPCWKGIVLYLNVTAGSGAGGPQAQVFSVDTVTGAANQALNAAPTAPTSATTVAYGIYPSIGNSVAFNQTTSAQLPGRFLVTVTASTSSYTYSLSCSLLK